MTPALKIAIIAAHASIYPVVALCIWIFAYHRQFYCSRIRLRSLASLYWGYACFAIASSFEIAEHIGDHWEYVNQLSTLNLLFYAFINLGLGLISLGLKKNKVMDFILIASLIALPLLYGVNGSKGLIQIPLLTTTIIFMAKWFMVMRDRRVFLYLLFSNGLAIGLGAALIQTGNQIFHVFIGPANAIGLLILSYIAWIQPQKRSIVMGRPGT